MAKEKSLTTTCKHCGAEIAKSAKTCPQCGGKNKKPVYKRVWFWILIVILVFALIGSSGGSSDNSSSSSSTDTKKEEKIEYTAVDVHDMLVLLHDNSMQAEDYTDQYLEISGVVGEKDSDGGYINIACPYADDYNHMETCWLSSVQAYIKDDETKDIIKPMNKGDAITVRVKVTDVGEVMGYQADIIEVVQ